MSYRDLRDLIDKLDEEKLDLIVRIFYAPGGRLFTGLRLYEYQEGEDGPPGIPVIVADIAPDFR